MDNQISYKIKKGFISEEESKKIVKWIESINHKGDGTNHHLKEISKSLNGVSYIFDISDTGLTNYIANFQSVSGVSKEELPDFVKEIHDRICKEFGFSKENTFLQAVDMRKGGKINPHYDAALDGYVNYKCNISVLSEDYNFYIDKESISVEQRDLYGFEASLYKHWTNEFNSRRVFLSFGFVIPYKDLNRDSNDPRIRLSKRIEKYFQSQK